MFNLFKLEENGTNFFTESIAGLTTFMTMAYIIFVNPQILGDAGMDAGAVMTATILMAGLSTILIGLVTNYPFALASGMGLNAFFAYVVAAQYGWQAALAVVFVSGIIFLLLALTQSIRFIDAAVPVGLKNAVAAGIGLFIAFIGLQNGGVIVNSPATQITLGPLTESGPMLTLIGIVITTLLIARQLKGAILIGILLTTLIGCLMGVTDPPASIGDIVGAPSGLGPVALKMDFSALLHIPFFVIFSLVFVDVFDSLGTFMGIGAKSGYLDEEGRLPRINECMLVDSIGTMGGALLGTSTVTAYIESSAGISEGGKTGLTSVVVGLLFLLALFFSPLADLIPPEATAPALVIVGVMMAGAIKNIEFDDFTEALPAFLTILMMPLAYSIADGIAFGFISYAIVKVAAGRRREVHWLVYVLALAGLIHFFHPIR